MNASAQSMNGERRRGLAAVGVDVKKLPWNKNAEASILGGIILGGDERDPAKLLALVPELEPDDFQDTKHGIVFEAMRNLDAKGRPIDIVTLETEIERQGKLEAIGGVSFLGELAQVVPTSDNLVAYCDEVRLHAKNRRAIKLLASAVDRAMNWVHDPTELVAEIVGELQRFEEGRLDQRKGLRWTTPITEYLGEAEPGDNDAEDWILRDFIPRSEAWILGGPPKSGKTWQTIDLGIALALGEDWIGFENTLGKPARVMLVLLEDGLRRLHKRGWELARGRGISFHDDRLKENLRISGEPFYLPDSRDERRLIDEARAFKADVILTDNLTRVMLGESKDERDVKAFARSWKYITDETKASVGFLHHTRKSTDGNHGKDPFDALRGDGGILGFARHAIVVLPRRDEGEKQSEVHMRGNLDLQRESFVLGFERRWRHDDRKWQARFHDRGQLEQAREKAVESKKEARTELKRTKLETKIEKQLDKAIQIARTKGHVTKLEVAVAFGMSSDTGVRRAFDLGVERGRLIQLKGRERNLGYRLSDATQKELL